MKNKLLFTTLLFISLVSISCKEYEDKKQVSEGITVKSVQIAEVDLRKASLNIKGMTCEIGCARTIQSKLAKTDGVKFAKVNFNEKTGIVEYDANKVSEKQIVAIVERIADGDLYKVAKITSTE